MRAPDDVVENRISGKLGFHYRVQRAGRAKLLKDLDCTVVYKEAFSKDFNRILSGPWWDFKETCRQNALTLSLIQ